MWLCLSHTFQEPNPQLWHSPDLHSTSRQNISWPLARLNSMGVHTSKAYKANDGLSHWPVYWQVWIGFPWQNQLGYTIYDSENYLVNLCIMWFHSYADRSHKESCMGSSSWFTKENRFNKTLKYSHRNKKWNHITINTNDLIMHSYFVLELRISKRLSSSLSHMIQ